MVIKSATQVGNPLIRTKVKRVINPKLKAVQRAIKDLTDSMRHHDLVGMAAPQIGKNMSVFVSEIRNTKFRKRGEDVKDVDPLRVFINPTITWFSQREMRGWEGCGSVASADLFGTVKRPTTLIVKALDEKGSPFELKATGLLARVIQHELDHLNGKVFTDKVDLGSLMSRDEYLKKRAKEV